MFLSVARRNTLADTLEAVNEEDRLVEQRMAHEQYYTRRRQELKRSLLDSERAAKSGGLHAGNEEYWQLESDLKNARRKLAEAPLCFRESSAWCDALTLTLLHRQANAAKTELVQQLERCQEQLEAEISGRRDAEKESRRHEAEVPFSSPPSSVVYHWRYCRS